MRTQVAMIAISAGLLGAQQKPAPSQCEPPAGSVRKILQVQNRRTTGVAQLAKGLGLCVAHDDSRLVAVSGPPAGVQALEDALKKTDTTSKERDVEFIGYLLLATGDAEQAEPLPAALNGVVQQLRSVFPYKSYRLLDTLMTRQGGNLFRQAEIRSSLPMIRAAGEGRRGAGCVLQFQVNAVPNEGGARIFFDGLNLTIDDGEGNTVVIQTSTAIRDGQKVVIGKANGAKPNQTYFLVASARLVD